MPEQREQGFFDITLSSKSLRSAQKLQMSTVDKEKLELMLISHPLVKAYIKPIFSRS